MNEKMLLIPADGMRPDAVHNTALPHVTVS